MRIPGLLRLLLTGLLVAAAVSASAQSPSRSLPPPASPTPREPVIFFGPCRVLKDITPIQDAVCYTMRSYKVERSERFTDGDGVVGYSTCQPSTQSEFKQAVQTVTDPK
ncbi:MAG: hypothetical protein WB421_03600 [Terriglobales bacterium]|jgi:hypothetical protein